MAFTEAEISSLPCRTENIPWVLVGRYRTKLDVRILDIQP
jgi:hypothetical protein